MRTSSRYTVTKIETMGRNMATKKTSTRTRAGAARKTSTRTTTKSTRATKPVQIPEVTPAPSKVSRLTMGTTRKVEKEETVTAVETLETPDVAEDTTVTPLEVTEATDTEEDDSDPEFRRPDLIEKVMERSGMKRKDVKPVVEAMLAVMGDLLVAEQDMNIAPLGKVMIKNSKELEKAHVLTVKVRRPKQIEAAEAEV